MALGALISAYQEDDSRRLRALCSARRPDPGRISGALRRGVGRSADRRHGRAHPAALNEAFERLRGEGISVFPVSDGSEAASRFEAGALILLLADGLAPDVPCCRGSPSSPSRRSPWFRTTRRTRSSSGSMRRAAGPAWRWSRADARLDRGHARRLGPAVDLAAARGPGRRAAAAGREPGPGPCSPSRPGGPGRFRAASAGRDPRRARDWASRYVLPIVEEFATERLMEAGSGRLAGRRWRWSSGLGRRLLLSRGWLWPGWPAAPLDPARPGRGG